ncbi:MAG: hypothetical protein ACJAXH_002288 [Colwellia sp.]|jgi:hypothetical protein
MNTFSKTTAIIFPLVLGSVLISGYSNANSIQNTDISFKGYIQLDTLFSQYSDGSLPAGSIGRDFYVPSLTPVGGAKESTQFDAHAKRSRFRLTSKTDTGNGESITGVLELDFSSTPGGNERISNSYTPRIRHAYFRYNGWTFGQTWSTFQDVKTLPERLDAISVTDGTIFNRQPIVKYQSGAWEFSLENSESTITPFEGGSRIVSDDGYVPDAVIRYTHKSDWGHVSLAGLVRQLTYETEIIDDSTISYGINVSSKIKVGSHDDLRISFTTGSGLGRYLGLNTSRGAVINSEGNLEAIDSTGFAVAYRKVWSKKMRSSFSYSKLMIDNNVALTGTKVTESTSNISANLLYSPTPKITFGSEIRFATRDIESGLSGDMTRLQLSARYKF